MMKRFSWALSLMCCLTLTILITGCPAVDPPPGQPVDTDSDGVIDEDDLCPGTAAGATVDADGCSAAQLNTDTDDDGVINSADQCPGTPAGETVNGDGCSATQLDTDSDGDGVENDLDLCADTPIGDEVDADGCTIRGISDRDGDGVADDDDECPNTPTGNVVDSTGCTVIVGGGNPVCGDGVKEGTEQCDTSGASASCDADCTTPSCGDGELNTAAGEQCEPPNSDTCDNSCHQITLNNFTADNCEDAPTLSGEGAFDLDNSIATLDGPPHARCAQVGFGDDQIDRDVWAIWNATCTATVFVQTCGLTTADTRIAVYDGSACPTGDESFLGCNDDRCDLQSLVTFEAVTGQDYLIRVGSYPGELGGIGGVSITCGIDSCPGEGDCLTANGTVGCDDESCCEKVCNLDSYCCENEWDATCALEANGLCSGSFDTCVAGAGDCTIARTPICRNGTRATLPCADDSDCPGGACVPQPPGCGDVECCNAVCQDDPFCCIDTWDDFCVAAEPRTCFLSCGAGSGSCLTARGEGSEESGCDDVACCEQVCPRDSYCCEVEWDATCVEKAQIYCAP